MVRPSQEGRVRPLTDAESLEAGDGTTSGDDGTDIDTGGPGGGIAEPPVANVVQFIPDSSTWDGVLDFAVAAFWDITLGANLTGMTFANPPSSGLDAKMEVTYRQPAVGGPFTLDQPADADWRDTDGTAGGAEPTMPTADESVLVVTFDVRDGGTSYGGSYDSAAGSSSEEDFVPHGSMGSTEAFDPDDPLGHSHTGTLDADCTATISAPAGDGPIQMEWWITQDGTGGWDLTIAAAGGSVLNDTTPDTTASVVVRYVLDRIPGTSNDWIVNLVGGAGASVVALDDLSDVVITTPATDDILQYDGADWVNAALGDAVRDAGRWEVVMSGTGPPVAVSTPDDDDWVYAWVPG